MFYFIPSWYNSQRSWYDRSELWFRVFKRMEFDDTVNQYKMFELSEEPACLLLFNYQPQLRYFLHKQGMAGAKYWSFFDDIQNVHRKETNPINFKRLSWPKDVRFLYNPFSVIAMVGSEILAYIHFAEDGNLMLIDFQKDGHSDRSYYFDDRGFLSSICYFSDSGNAIYQDYFNENGVWQVREHLTNGFKVSQIEINPESDKEFEQTHYQSWEELLSEKLSEFNSTHVLEDDKVVIAANEQHNHLIMSIFKNQKKGFSFFKGRYLPNQNAASRELLSVADLLIVDTQEQETELKKSLTELGLENLSEKISRISPFDTRLRLGHSQLVKELIVYFFIDTISKEELKERLIPILTFMDTNPLLKLDMVTFNQDKDLSEIKLYIEQVIFDKLNPANFFGEVEDSGENGLDDASEGLKNITIQVLSNESQVIATLDQARVVLDLGNSPDLYTQIASISAGIPQINSIPTSYVSHKKNGWILSDNSSKELLKALSFYLDSLSHWNESLVYSVKKMSDYTSGHILSQWKELLR